MKSLFLYGGGAVDLPRRRQQQGAVLVPLHPESEEALRRAGVAFDPGTGGERESWIESAADAWLEAWPHHPLLDGRSFADVVTWKGEPLSGFAQACLRRSPRAVSCVRLVERLWLLLGARAPDEVEAAGLHAAEALLLSRLCTAQKILFHGEAPPARRGGVARAWWASRRAALAELWPGARRSSRSTTSAAAGAISLVEGELPTGAGAVPPLRVESRDWADRRVLREVARARRQFREQWHLLRGSPALHEAFSHRGVNFADLAASDLAHLMLVELPQVVRRYEEVAARLGALRRGLVCLRPEDRPAQAACRAASVAFVFPPARRPALAAPGGVVGS